MRKQSSSHSWKGKTTVHKLMERKSNGTKPFIQLHKLMERKSFAPMILMLSLVTFLAASLCTSSPIASIQTDQIALLSCKDLITKDPLGALSSWNSSINLCQWHGVKCGHRHQRVVELDLRSQRLEGSLSPFIGNLSFLRSIYLQDNWFRGNIPQEISQLSRLQNLNFSFNALQGEIPSNLSNCLNLKFIALDNNNLVGRIPATFDSLSKLTSLLIFSNNLHGNIPPSLGNLSLLQHLSMGPNKLEGTIPESIGHLRNLKRFSIGENKISGIVPPSLYNISTVIMLSLAENQLTGTLPGDIALMLPNLREFSVGGNQFTGHFPASFSNASQMSLLDLCGNGFIGPIPVDLGRRMNDLRILNLCSNNFGTGIAGSVRFVDSLTNCSILEYLSLNDNEFVGVLPNSITNLSTQLRVLLAQRNQFVGKIPQGISNLVNLFRLGLHENLLSGSIPFNIGMLQKLQGMALSGNQLSGSIPESISNLTQIIELHLQDNNLTGNFPWSLANVQSLQILNLSHNNLGGSVPKTIGLVSSLLFLNLAHNSFNDSLPSEFGTLSNIGVLDISFNDLSGELPMTLGNCLKLEALRLSSNSFHGSIPSSLASLRGLVDLDLSHNNFSGPIPIDLEKLPFLGNLNLSFNNLEGKMPLKGAFRNISVISIVGNKNLCGGIPYLRLPVCSIQEPKKQNNHLGSKVIIAIISVGIFLVLLMFVVAIYWKRKPRNALSRTPLGEEFFRVSYNELLKATDGFSSSNLLGVGSFGSVYKGMLQQNEKPIAVKVFDLERFGASESFIAECEVLRKTRHRNLLKIITACSSINFEGNDFKALVFDFMQNGSLESWLHPSENTIRKLKFTQRLNIAINVVFALEYLHHHCETPIIHCDLKPSNVLLDEDMIAHVGDFGLAKFLATDISNPIEGQATSIAIKGSIGYIAPEYGMGEPISAQGDIYSFGILLLEMFTRKRPTHEMFKDGPNLHHFCKMALPDKVMDIADLQMLILEEELNDRMKAKMRECLISLVRTGVACSTETPNERMGISEIVMELNAIKQGSLSFGIN